MKETHLNYICSGITTTIAMLNLQDLESLIMLILGIISFCLSIAYTVYKWYKISKQDGKIDINEVNQLGEDISELIEKSKKIVKK